MAIKEDKMDYIRVQIDPEMKKNAQALFEDMGLNLSQGIKLLLKQCINHHGIPFEITARTPNAETLAAMRDAEEGKLFPLKNTDELRKMWDDL